MAGSLTGPERARADLEEILTEQDRVEIGEALALMAERGHPAGRVDRARRALEVEMIREGPPGSRQTFYWQLPGSCPTCLRPYGPVAVHETTPWGGDRAGNTDYWSKPQAPIEPPSLPPEVQRVPPPLPNLGPPRCNICGRASAMSVGDPCPYWTTSGNQRCPGTMQ